jgi:hypothetical protein
MAPPPSISASLLSPAPTPSPRPPSPSPCRPHPLPLAPASSAALLYCCTGALVHCCTAALLHCCTAALLYARLARAYKLGHANALHKADQHNTQRVQCKSHKHPCIVVWQSAELWAQLCMLLPKPCMQPCMHECMVTKLSGDGSWLTMWESLDVAHIMWDTATMLFLLNECLCQTQGVPERHWFARACRLFFNATAMSQCCCCNLVHNSSKLARTGGRRRPVSPRRHLHDSIIITFQVVTGEQNGSFLKLHKHVLVTDLD